MGLPELTNPEGASMSESTTAPLAFETPVGLPLDVTFDAGRLTSDGGLVWMAEADRTLELCARLAACIPDWRRGAVRHSLETLLRQRLFQIACGYADQNDATTLRTDPRLKLVCGRLPTSDPDLASQPTLSRLENAVDRHTIRRLALALLELYLEQRGRDGPPTRVVLDFDGTDDPAHGQQEGVGYHGSDRQHMYHPLLLFDGDTGQLITAILRPGTCHASRFVLLVLHHRLPRLRARWPAVPVEVRADSGFASPKLYTYCERHQVGFTIGLIPNPVLSALAAPLLAEAERQSQEPEGAKVRLAGEATYQAGTWTTARRVVFKAEVLAKGPNTRFVVTTRTDEPLEVYDWYVDRGEPENWVKELKNALQADRLSCHRFWANAFRLLLHAAAYWLFDTLRHWLAPTEAAHWQFDTLRLQLIKIAGRVRQLATRVRLQLASGHPGEPLWHQLAARSPAPVNNSG
jgi:Transposase DDE domain group 1